MRTARGQNGDIAWHIGATDDVKDHIHTAAARDVFDRRSEIFVLVEDRFRATERGQRDGQVAAQRLSPLILRRAVLDPCIERFADVMGRHHARELLALDVETFCDRGIESTGHSSDDPGCSKGRVS